MLTYSLHNYINQVNTHTNRRQHVKPKQTSIKQFVRNAKGRRVTRMNKQKRTILEKLRDLEMAEAIREAITQAQRKKT